MFTQLVLNIARFPITKHVKFLSLRMHRSASDRRFEGVCESVSLTGMYTLLINDTGRGLSWTHVDLMATCIKREHCTLASRWADTVRRCAQLLQRSLCVLSYSAFVT